MKRCVMYGLFGLALISAFASARSPKGFLNQNEKIVFDDANYLLFEDVGRITHTDENGNIAGRTAGKYVRLHICRDGKEYDINLTNPKYSEQNYPTYLLIMPEVKEIKYRDKDNVWIISRVGHLSDGALLFNIVTQKVESSYTGAPGSFDLSPDASTIAYYYYFMDDRHGRHHIAVFVNGVMIYPTIMGGFYFRFWEGFIGPRTKEGVPFNEITKSYPTSDIETPIVWKSADTVEFAVKENVDKTSETQSLKYIVSGLSSQDTSITLENIHVQKNLIVK